MMTDVLGFIPLFIGTQEIIIIAIIILLLFGGKKIPELMKGLGKGVKSFKDGMNEVSDEINRPSSGNQSQNNNNLKEDK